VTLSKTQTPIIPPATTTMTITPTPKVEENKGTGAP
jgi:hypothetical protein